MENDTLPPIFFNQTAPPSQPFVIENDPLPPSFNKSNPIYPIFQQIWPTPIYFSTKTTHSYHCHPFFHWSSTKATCIHQLFNYLHQLYKNLQELTLPGYISKHLTAFYLHISTQIFCILLICFVFDVFSNVLFQKFDYFWNHVPSKLLISLCWHILH